MGNDSSKQTIENQQIILQLQQQLLQQQKNHYQEKYPNKAFNNSPRIISPAEMQQRTPHPGYYQENHQNEEENTKPRSLLDILQDKRLMVEIDKNPATKRKFLERLLNEQRHIMTTAKVNRISAILNSLPPIPNYNTKQYQNPKLNTKSNPKSNLDDIYNQNNVIGFHQGTTRQDSESRELQTREQLNTINALTKHYKTEAEREEAEFKLEEERRRKEFLERQRARRANYNSKLEELERDQVDALRLFNLQANYTLDDLKQAYKKLAMRTHPDKPTGNAEQFQLVTKCYLSLLEKYKARESDRQFNDLKKGSQSYLEDQSRNGMVNKEFAAASKSKSKFGGSSKTIDKDKFDAKLFNKIYEQNKLWDSNDDGYGSWFTSQDTEEPPTELFGNKFNLNVFNSTFEEHKERLTDQTGAIQQYNEPRELVSYSGGFTDIDQEVRKVDDFSKPSPVAPSGRSGKELGYTDLKTAYTSRGAFIDPSKVEYKTYKSVDELKRDRGNVRYDMNDDELTSYEQRKYKEAQEEEHRQHLIKQRDNQIANSYSRIHERMLGYRGTAPS
jgi:curved DNA-binding protein CbpA